MKRHVMLHSSLIPSIVPCHGTAPSLQPVQEWQAALQQQVRAARQSCVLPSKTPSLQPLPPPHVSTLTPPYSDLTAWIRSALAQNQLSLEHIRSLRKPGRVFTEAENTKTRQHKTECVIYPQLKVAQPSLEALDRNIMMEFHRKQKEAPAPATPVSLKEPESPGFAESNPFGFIHYMERKEEPVTGALYEGERPSDEIVSYDEVHMRHLLPKSLLESKPSLVSRQDTLESQESLLTHDAPWGRRLPPLAGTAPPLRVTSELGPAPRQEHRSVPHSSSAPALTSPKSRRKGAPRKAREVSPPDWISCFPKSPKPRRRVPEDAYTKGPPVRPPPMKFIDKTPSANSLNLPYCPPVLVDYEDFSNSQLFRLQAEEQPANLGFTSPQLPRRNKTRLHSKVRRSRSLDRSTSQLVVIPVESEELPRMHCSELVTTVAAYPSFPRRQESVRAPVCTCDSRRSSDSGLADVLVHTDPCPLGRSLQSVTSLPGPHQPHPPAPRQCSCGAPLPPPQLTIPPPPPQLSQSLDHLATSPPPRGDEQAALSCGDLASGPSPPSRWTRTKETYKTGLYAHWWLNASLQPITEEPHMSTQL